MGSHFRCRSYDEAVSVNILPGVRVLVAKDGVVSLWSPLPTVSAARVTEQEGRVARWDLPLDNFPEDSRPIIATRVLAEMIRWYEGRST